MAYATVADVQALVPAALVTLSGASEPGEATVTDWLAATSGWMDASLGWKYVVPVTHAGDLDLLRPIAAGLVAARVLAFLAATNGALAEVAAELRAEALLFFVYQPGAIRPSGSSLQRLAQEHGREGRSLLVLPNTALADPDSGEAALQQPLGTFTDPAAEGSTARLFEVGREV